MGAQSPKTFLFVVSASVGDVAVHVGIGASLRHLKVMFRERNRCIHGALDFEIWLQDRPDSRCFRRLVPNFRFCDAALSGRGQPNVAGGIVEEGPLGPQLTDVSECC